jgi:glutathione S-transferase
MSVLELYHTVNSVCSQKVRIQLKEKALDWTSHPMTLRGDQFSEEYLKLNPNGVVPTLIHDEQPVIESSVILYYLEECFPNVRLMPQDPLARANVRLFNKLIDEYVHNACTVLTFAIAFRSHFQKMNSTDLEDYLSSAPNKTRSEQKRDVIAHGLDSKFCVEAIEHFVKLLQRIEHSACGNDYLAGNEFSLADVAVIPYLIRLDMLRLSPIWGSYNALPRWYERVRSRPAVEHAIIGCMTQSDNAPFEQIEFDSWSHIGRVLKRSGTSISKMSRLATSSHC